MDVTNIFCKINKYTVCNTREFLENHALIKVCIIKRHKPTMIYNPILFLEHSKNHFVKTLLSKIERFSLLFTIKRATHFEGLFQFMQKEF
jgi:hypothetical protein